MVIAKPRLRGVSHHVAFYIALCAGVALLLAADAHRITAIAIYVAALAGMLGVSASYHRVNWSPRLHDWWGRADHAMIFTFIAATYTPLCLLGLDRSTGHHLLALVWIGAGLGIVRAFAWPDAPRTVTAALYVAVGWLVLAYFPDVYAAFDRTSLALVLAGGACYTLGAVVYATRRPDPSPAVFGYHEVFHALVLVACSCHFAAVARLALA